MTNPLVVCVVQFLCIVKRARLPANATGSFFAWGRIVSAENCVCREGVARGLVVMVCLVAWDFPAFVTYRNTLNLKIECVLCLPKDSMRKGSKLL
jgi:hypothetical protein